MRNRDDELHLRTLDEPAVEAASFKAKGSKKTSRNGVYIFAGIVFAVVFAASLAALSLAPALGLWSVFLASLLGLVCAFALRIAPQWEKVVVLRLGKFNRVAGPGLYFVIPFVEHAAAHVDQRMITTPFVAEEALTADLTPLNIDAVLFWMVWDAEKACTEVEDYYAAVSFLAQTAMREAVGRSTVAEVALRRDQLDAEIKADIEKEAAGWGVDIISVKVRDIVIPEELQEAMSLEAQADRERSARTAVASAEADVAEMLKEAADIYGDPEAALKLRTMLMQYETVKKSKGSVVTVPSAMSDGFIDKMNQ